jgi:hypothetical protein
MIFPLVLKLQLLLVLLLILLYIGGVMNKKNPISTPTTWAELKAAMRHRFVPSYYACNAECEVQGCRSKQYSNSFAGQSSTSSSAPALLAPSALTTTTLEIPAPSTPTTTPLERTTASFANAEPSLHNAPNTPTENIGNAHGATFTEGENCVNVLNFSTNHALVEQLIVEPYLDLSLSQGDFLDVSCAKDELCATTSVLHASAENKLVMNSPFVVQDCDRLEGNHHTTTFQCSSRSFDLNKTVDFQEGEHHWFLPSILALSSLGTNLLQDGVEVQCVPSNHEGCMLAEFSCKMSH